MTESGKRRDHAKEPDHSYNRIQLKRDFGDNVWWNFQNQCGRKKVKKNHQADAREHGDDALGYLLLTPLLSRLLFAELNPRSVLAWSLPRRDLGNLRVHLLECA